MNPSSPPSRRRFLQTAGCLGGVWTAGLLTKIIDGGRKSGVMHEIMQAMSSRGSEVAKRTKGEIYDPEQIGVREGRRICGRNQVTAGDIVAGQKHADGVCQVNFGFDLHNVRAGAMFEGQDEIETLGRHYRKLGAKPYDIPLGALIAADVEGLMMAGRCISGDFIAHSSYRVTGNAVPMGEAAGKVSAASVRLGRLPHELQWKDVSRA